MSRHGSTALSLSEAQETRLGRVVLQGGSGAGKYGDAGSAGESEDAGESKDAGELEGVGESEDAGDSGLLMLDDGLDAFVARIVLADMAECTLDVQYYLFHGDQSGQLVAQHLLMAADRGVRVRLLLDDMGAAGKDVPLAAIDAHPNVQVRIFNPVAGRSGLSRMLSMAGDFSRINRRMHNKMLVADNVLGIAGGRNIGNEYFMASEHVNFADMDLLAAGPVVRQMSEAFDTYWNSDFAYPVEVLHPASNSPQLLDRLRTGLWKNAATMRDSEYVRRLRGSDLAVALSEKSVRFIRAPARFVADDVRKAAPQAADDKDLRLGPQLLTSMLSATEDIVIVSPYFIPGEQGMELFRVLRDRGIRVRVLTNALSATDVPIVYGGYARYRKPLLRLGVELYEMKALPEQHGDFSGGRKVPEVDDEMAESATSSVKDMSGATDLQIKNDMPDLRAKGGHLEKHDLGHGSEQPIRGSRWYGSSGASLHTKALVFDGRELFVGSMNLDPRSIVVNTEQGLVVESEELSHEVLQLFEKLTSPEFSYRLELETVPASDGRRNRTEERLAWVGVQNGKPFRMHHEPNAGFWKSLSVNLLMLFAPEDML